MQRGRKVMQIGCWLTSSVAHCLMIFSSPYPSSMDDLSKSVFEKSMVSDFSKVGGEYFFNEM